MTEENKNVRKVSTGLWFGIFLFPAILLGLPCGRGTLVTLVFGHSLG